VATQATATVVLRGGTVALAGYAIGSAALGSWLTAQLLLSERNQPAPASRRIDTRAPRARVSK
jgi:hypothetical protein